VADSHIRSLRGSDTGVFPPNTLFRLKEIRRPGEWEAPGDESVFPNQRLLVCTRGSHIELAQCPPSHGTVPSLSRARSVANAH
jgi:hypothetical protein